MSVIVPTSQTAPVFYPNSDYKIAKYLDLTKFISILQRQELFFCRLDKLEDHFEGTTAKSNWEHRANLFRTQHLRSRKFPKMSEEEINKEVQDYFDADKRMKALKCVCCWNKNQIESAALWKIYSDFQKGIMISSSIEKLKASFQKTREDISLSEIKYINHKTDFMPDGNTMYPVIYKHNAYSYEEEVRLIHTVDFEGGLIYDWKKEEVEQGKYIQSDLEILINEIVISPYAPNWYFDIVKNLCEKYNINKPIIKSELSMD